jgi:hypothetical protein
MDLLNHTEVTLNTQAQMLHAATSEMTAGKHCKHPVVGRD